MVCISQLFEPKHFQVTQRLHAISKIRKRQSINIPAFPSCHSDGYAENPKIAACPYCKINAQLILHLILLLSEVYRVTEPEEKRHGHDVQNPPVSCKPLELIHG
jgi:hypothetical protein